MVEFDAPSEFAARMAVTIARTTALAIVTKLDTLDPKLASQLHQYRAELRAVVRLGELEQVIE